jgi:hypothetical protein
VNRRKKLQEAKCEKRWENVKCEKDESKCNAKTGRRLNTKIKYERRLNAIYIYIYIYMRQGYLRRNDRPAECHENLQVDSVSY